MKLLSLQRHLLVLLSLTGVAPLPTVLTKSTKYKNFLRYGYTLYALLLHTLLASSEVHQIVVRYAQKLNETFDKITSFVILTQFLHWEIVLIVVVIHNCLKFRKLDRFIDTIYQIEQKIVILENRRSFLILKCLVGASVTVRIIFLTYSFTQSTMLVMNEICTTFNDLLFDLYNLHVLVQVWCLRRCFKTLNRRFIDALTSGEFNMIFEVLQLTDQLYTALRIFNGYYGLFMLGVCLVAFIRTSLATYLAMLALLERWDGGRVIFVIVLTVGSYTIFNCGIVYAIFYVCHTTIDEVSLCQPFTNVKFHAFFNDTSGITSR